MRLQKDLISYQFDHLVRELIAVTNLCTDILPDCMSPLDLGFIIRKGNNSENKAHVFMHCGEEHLFDSTFIVRCFCILVRDLTLTKWSRSQAGVLTSISQVYRWWQLCGWIGCFVVKGSGLDWLLAAGPWLSSSELKSLFTGEARVWVLGGGDDCVCHPSFVSRVISGCLGLLPLTKQC